MSERRKQGAKRNKTVAYIGAALVHIVIIGAMVFNFSSKHESIDAAYAEKVDVVKATTIDESQIKEQQDKLKKADAAKKRREAEERRRLEELRKKRVKEEDQIEELEKKKEIEKKEAERLEAKRKEIALKKQQEEEKAKKAKEKREREEKARKERERLAAEKKEQERLEKEELDRIEAEERELLAAQEMQRLIDEEEAMLAAQRAEQRTTTLLQKYTALIKDKVDRNRTILPDFERWRVATVIIKLSPQGDVLNTQIVQSSGSERYDRSVESAILKASPFPMPDRQTDPSANSLLQNIEYTFPMPGV